MFENSFKILVYKEVFVLMLFVSKVSREGVKNGVVGRAQTREEPLIKTISKSTDCDH